MNKVYRTVWNEHTNTWVAVQETAKARGKSSQSGGSIVSELGIGGSRFMMTAAASAVLLMSGQVMAADGNKYPTGQGSDNYCYYDTTSQSVVCGDATTSVADTYDSKTAKSTAIGFGAKTTGESNVALGAGSSAAKTAATALGASAKALNDYGVAIGYESAANNTWDISIGRRAGANAVTSGDGRNIAIGDGALREAKNANNNTVLGTSAGAGLTGSFNIAMGAYANSPTANGSPITADNTIALGQRAVASTSSSIALGNRTKATGAISNAIGTSAEASGDYSVANGYAATASGNNAIAIGAAQNLPNKTEATGAAAIAIGTEAKASHRDATAIGKAANAAGQDGIAVGLNANAAGQGVVAIGTRTGTKATAGYIAPTDAVFIGASAGYQSTNNTRQIAIGNNAGNKVGTKATTASLDNIAIGHEAGQSINGDRNLALGKGAGKDLGTATDAVSDTIALGHEALASRDRGIAVGQKAQAAGVDGSAIAIGGAYKDPNGQKEDESTKAWANNAIAIGTGAEAGLSKAANKNPHYAGSNIQDPNDPNETIWDNPKTGAIAIGTRALSYEVAAVALGENAGAFGKASVALGTESTANNINGVAVGSGATAEADNTVAVGFKASADGTSAVAVGDNASTHKTANQSMALGNLAITNEGAVKGVAIGYKAVAAKNIEGAVALGAHSVADRDRFAKGQTVTAVDAPSLAARQVYVLGMAAGTDKDAVAATAANTLSAVSVGSTDTGETRQITNVAAGSLDSDAVNVAQLKAVANQIQFAGAGEHYYSVNSTEQGAGSNYNNNGASANGALAAGANTSASGLRATAVGYKANAQASDTVVIGNEALADNKAESAVVIGSKARVGGAPTGHSSKDAVAIGYSSYAKTASTIALGSKAKADGNSQATAIGYQANAKGYQSIAFGSDASAAETAGGSIAFGRETKTTAGAGNAVAIGNQSQAGVSDSVALGSGAATLRSGTTPSAPSGSIAIGRGAQTIDRGYALGINARATNESLAFGTNANFDGTLARTIGKSSIAIGNNTHAGGDRAIAFGNDSVATGLASIAHGSAAQAQGQSSVVIGDSARNERNTGNTSYPHADQVVAVGVSSNVNSLGGIAVGSTTKTTGVYGTAIGIGSVNNTDFGVALGALSTTDSSIKVNRDGYDPFNPTQTADATILATRANAAGVSVGGKVLSQQGSAPGQTAVRPDGVSDGDIIRRQIHNVAAGTDNTDAVNVAQLKAAGFKLAVSESGGSATVTTQPSNNTDDKIANGETFTLDAGKGISLVQNGGTVTIATNAQTLAESAQQPVVYTNADGDKLYLVEKDDPNGPPGTKMKVFNTKADGTGTDVDPPNVIASMQNAAGQTIYPMTLANVAAGSKAHDAVNVSQLGAAGIYEVGQNGDIVLENGAPKVRGLNFAGNTGEGNTKLGDTWNIVGGNAGGNAGDPRTFTAGTFSGGNIQTKVNNGLVEITMADSPKFGDIVINAPAITGSIDPKDDRPAGRITGVTAGVDDNDVVTVAQLKNVANGTNASPLTFAGDTGGDVSRKLGETVKIVGGMDDVSLLSDGANIGVVANGSDTLEIQLAKDLTGLSSAQFEDAGGNITTVDGNGITIEPADPNKDAVSLTGSGLNNGGNIISNVASGLNGKTLDEIKADPDAAERSNAATIGDLTLVQSNVTNVTNVVNNVVGGDKFIDPQTGELTDEGKLALTTYNVSGNEAKTDNTLISAIKNMNEGGIKFFHVNDGTGNQNTDGDATHTEDSSASGDYAAAIGYKAKASGENALAFGKGAVASGDNSISIGTGNQVAGDNSGAIGDPSIVDGNNSYSVGNNNAISNTANNSFVLGGQNSLGGTAVRDANGVIDPTQPITVKGTANNSAVIGNKNTVQTDNTFVLGNEVTQTLANSVFLGNQAGSTGVHKANASAANPSYYTYKGDNDTNVAGVKDVVGVVSVGKDGQTRQIQNVAAGVVSADSTDAINGSQLYYTHKAIEGIKNGAAGIVQYSNPDNPTQPNGGTVSNDVTLVGTTDGSGKPNPVTIHNVDAGRAPTDAVNVGQLNALGARLDGVANTANAGVAQAIATAGLPQAYLPGKSMVAVGGGYYKGETGYAVGFSTISDGGNWIIKGTASGNSRGHFGASVGAGYQW